MLLKVPLTFLQTRQLCALCPETLKFRAQQPSCKSKASDNRRCNLQPACNIVERIQIFTFLSAAENERSAVEELIEIATAIAYTLQRCGICIDKVVNRMRHDSQGLKKLIITF